MAPSADPKLVMFLYMLMRDMAPVGYVESTVARALKEHRQPPSAPELRELADRLARTLVHDDSSTVQPGGPPGTITQSTNTQEAAPA